jgi:transcriptional regulator with XRE-family HTH domain
MERETKTNQTPKLKAFSERFYKLRGERSQAEFAKFCGIARATVGFYDNGKRLPDALVLRQICEKCGVTSDYLLGLEDEPSHNLDDVRKEVGLSGAAVEMLNAAIEEDNAGNVGQLMPILNTILSDGRFYSDFRNLLLNLEEDDRLLEAVQITSLQQGILSRTKRFIITDLVNDYLKSLFQRMGG